MKINTISFPAVLPKFNRTLVKLHEDGKMLDSSKQFIYFWGTDLLERTNGEPTNNDYINYAKSIVTLYPDLKGGVTEHVSSRSTKLY